MTTSCDELDALLDKAPEAPSSDRSTITGILARTPDKTKFAIIGADGRPITLSRSTCRSHKVIASSVGQVIVEIELDPAKMSDEERASLKALTPSFQHKAWGAWWDVGPAFGAHYPSFSPVPPWGASVPAAPSPFILAGPDVRYVRKALDHWKPPPYDPFKHPISD